jgi:basic membrane protein A
MGQKLFAIGIIVLLFIVPLSTCYSDQPEKKAVKVIHFINGAQGDKSFFDSAVRGIAEAEADFHLEVTTIEAGYNSSCWKPVLEDAAANNDYDIMIVGTSQMPELLKDVAQMHPDKRFIIYDSSVNYTEGSFSNVYSILYKQNEGAYLAGVYAGLMTKSGIIGILGGQNTTTINDFVIGYEQGARSVRPDLEIMVQYAGSWNDLARGEALAKEMYGKGADIIFQAAGTTGMGVFKAAQQLGKYAIGVDSDQALIIERTDPEQAKHIPTSMMKNVDSSLYRALKLYIDGQLLFGQVETLGIKEGGVGLAKSKHYEEVTPDDIKAKINQTEINIRDGRIKVETAFK